MIKLTDLLKKTIVEALAVSKAKELYSISKSDKVIEYQNKIFDKLKSSSEYIKSNKNGDRLYFNFSRKNKFDDFKHHPPQSEISQDINKYLQNNGYDVNDYIKGTAFDKYGREVKIGKILQKLNPDLLQKFNNDISREASKEKDQLIVISKNAYDLGGASTDRGWNSCFNIEDGEHADEIYCGIKKGALIAYLILKDDLNINSPQARLLIYPYVSKKTKDTIYIPNLHIQGTAPKSFKIYIDKIFEDFLPKKGTYVTPISGESIDIQSYKNEQKFLFKIKNNIPFSKDELKIQNLMLAGKNITSLPNGLDIDNLASLANNPKLKNLPDDIRIGGDLWLSNTGIEDLPKNLKLKDVSLDNTPLAKKFNNDKILIRKAYPNIGGDIFV